MLQLQTSSKPKWHCNSWTETLLLLAQLLLFLATSLKFVFKSAQFGWGLEHVRHSGVPGIPGSMWKPWRTTGECQAEVRKAWDAAGSHGEAKLTLKDKRVKQPHTEAFRIIWQVWFTALKPLAGESRHLETSFFLTFCAALHELHQMTSRGRGRNKTMMCLKTSSPPPPPHYCCTLQIRYHCASNTPNIPEGFWKRKGNLPVQDSQVPSLLHMELHQWGGGLLC